VGVDHGRCLRVVAAPHVTSGGNHDQFFPWVQVLSRTLARPAAWMAASDRERNSQVKVIICYSIKNIVIVKMNRKCRLSTILLVWLHFTT
jgi:hypothetical protein